jgi:hypothetical protein
MALNRPYALGRNIRATAAPQTVVGTRPTHAATDSFVLQTYSVTPEEERTPRANPRATRSLRELYQGNKTINASIIAELLPKGAALPPDIGDLLTSAIGVQTIGGSSVTYSCNNSQAVPFNWVEFDTGLADLNSAEIKEALDTFVVEELKISISNTDMPMIQLDGPARNLIRTGRGQGSAILAGGETAITMNPTTLSRQFEVNSVIQIGTSVGAGSVGHRVTDINHGTGVLTFAPAVVGAQNPAPVVAPYSMFAEASTAGAPTPEIFCAMAFGAESGAQFEKAEISLKNNFDMVRPVGTPLVADFVPGFRGVSGSIEFSANRTDIQKLIRSSYVNTSGVNLEDLVFTFGQSGQPGSILTLNDCNMKWSALQMPQSERGMFTLPFTAQASSGTLEDEFSWVWQTLP